MNTVYTRYAKLANSSYISTTLGTNLFALSGETLYNDREHPPSAWIDIPLMLINVLLFRLTTEIEQ